MFTQGNCWSMTWVRLYVVNDLSHGPEQGFRGPVLAHCVSYFPAFVNKVFPVSFGPLPIPSQAYAKGGWVYVSFHILLLKHRWCIRAEGERTGAGINTYTHRHACT